MANEINADNVRGNPAFWAYWNGVANAIATVAPGKLTLANVDDSMQTVQFGANTMTAPNFFWGYNSYRGNWTNSNGFDNLFSTFATATQANPRPLMLTEWGSHNSTHDSNKNIIPCTPAQMANLITYVTGHHNNMLENRSDVGDPGGVCCGGTYFAWSNELWKADPPGFECNSKNAAPACHTQVWDPGPNMDFQDNIPGGYADEEAWGLFSIAPVDPKNRVPVVAGGCTGPWNPKTNSPYPPDTLTLLDHGRALFKAFDDNLYVVNYGPYALTKYVGPQDRNKNPPVKVTVGPASFTTVAPQQVTGGPPWQVTEHLTGPYLNDTNVTKLPAVIAFEPNYLTAVAY